MTTTSTTTTNTSSASHSASRRPLIWSSLVLLVLLTAHTRHQRVEAKPVNQNQVKFRRVPPKEFSAALGSSITIECEANSSPPPTIHWLKDGKRIIQNDQDENQLDDDAVSQAAPVEGVTRLALSTSRSRLYIDCADLIDEATYTCVAENAYSRISSQTKLNLIKPVVQAVAVSNGNENDLDEAAALSEALDGPASGKGASAAAAAAAGSGNALSAVPQCLSERLRTGSSPPASARITMWTHNIVEIMKNNVVLLCRSNIKRQQQQDLNLISGNNSGKQHGGEMTSTSVQSSGGASKASLTWTLPNDKLVSEGQKDKYEVLETGDLLIKDLSWADMGNYVCTVSDEQSSDSVSAFVYPTSLKSSSSKRSATGMASRMLTRFR